MNGILQVKEPKDLALCRDRLCRVLQEMRSVGVAYSGGVDSALVMWMAHDLLKEAAIAMTSISPTFPVSQLEEAKALAARRGIRHLFVESDELTIPGYVENGPGRCYLCKHDLYTKMGHLIRREGIAWIADGTHLDDLGDVRPGLTAARQLGVRSPLVEAGMNKADVRALSRQLGLSTWDKPASACLSSRFPRGTRITHERLRQVEAAEAVLQQAGFRQFRVRYHDAIARIELAQDEFHQVLDVQCRQTLMAQIQACGFTWVTLDLAGYGAGSPQSL